jgi:hypothetical protein
LRCSRYQSYRVAPILWYKSHVARHERSEFAKQQRQFFLGMNRFTGTLSTSVALPFILPISSPPRTGKVLCRDKPEGFNLDSRFSALAFWKLRPSHLATSNNSRGYPVDRPPPSSHSSLVCLTVQGTETTARCPHITTILVCSVTVPDRSMFLLHVNERYASLSSLAVRTATRFRLNLDLIS